MAKVKDVDKRILELKKLLKTNKIVLGTDQTLKILRLNNADKVFLSSNCPDEIRKDIKYYASLCKVQIIVLKQPNDELGTLCKKPYPVSVLTLSK